METDFEKNVARIIHSLKHCIAEPGVSGEIPMLLGGGQAAKLRIVTIKDLENAGLIRKFAQWRKKHEEWFPAKFNVTLEGTKRWLDKGVLENRERMLFCIEDMEGNALGHMGFYRFDFEREVCEVDNIVRGEGGEPGLMTAALKAMMGWGIENLHVKGYRLQTHADNAKAISLYERCGFVPVRENPIVRKKIGERVEWVPAGEGETAEKFMLEMRWAPKKP